MRHHMTRIRYFGLLVALVLTIGCFLKDVHADSAVKRSKGQIVYLPVYSHVFIGTQRLRLELSVNASIRNTDPSNAITIVRADYYDTDGNLVERYIKEPATLKPLASRFSYIETSNIKGGTGANFIVEWKSDVLTTPPIIEALMSGFSGTRGYSYVSRGQVIEESTK